MTVIRFNTGNIKFKQRRPKRDTFVDCWRYFSLLSRSVKLAKQTRFLLETALWIHLLFFVGRGSKWFHSLQPPLLNDTVSWEELYSVKKWCQYPKLQRQVGIMKFTIREMALTGQAPELRVEESLITFFFSTKFSPHFFPGIDSSLGESSTSIIFRRA